jgi:NADPH:quinone reductase-like Zn-dependent oxidoreductase
LDKLLTMSMQAYQLVANSGFDALQRVELPVPQPLAGEVLVRVKAVSLNYRDLLVAGGTYPGLQLPLIPLSDGAGEVVAIGAGVTRVNVGDRVAGGFFQTWQTGRLTQQQIKSALGGAIDGLLAEYVVLNQAGVVVLPAHLTYVEGATLPCAAVTAWQALVERGRLTMGETVLLLGTGGVSIFALQFAKRLGARVIIISSSDAKLAKALAMGADLTINYHQVPDWEQRVWELTGGEGVDQVIEVGGAGTLEKSLRAVRVGGRISLIGVLAGAGEVNHAHILRKSIDVQGIPVVDRVFDFADAPDAYQYLQSGAHFGKVAVSLG